MKESYILHTDTWPALMGLSDEQLGRLFRAINLYQIGEELPDMDPATEMAFTFMAAQMDRDNDKYEKTVEKRRAAANARYANASKSMQVHANGGDTVTDTVNGNVTGTDTVNVTGTVNGTVTDTESPKGDKRERGADAPGTRSRVAFKAPSVEEVREYAASRGDRSDPEAFVDYYEANGWMVGRSKMKDWRAAWRNWVRREAQSPAREPERAKSFTEIAMELNERMGGRA